MTVTILCKMYTIIRYKCLNNNTIIIIIEIKRQLFYSKILTNDNKTTRYICIYKTNYAKINQRKMFKKNKK